MDRTEYRTRRYLSSAMQGFMEFISERLVSRQDDLSFGEPHQQTRSDAALQFNNCVTVIVQMIRRPDG